MIESTSIHPPSPNSRGPNSALYKIAAKSGSLAFLTCLLGDTLGDAGDLGDLGDLGEVGSARAPRCAAFLGAPLATSGLAGLMGIIGLAGDTDWAEVGLPSAVGLGLSSATAWTAGLGIAGLGVAMGATAGRRLFAIS